MKYFKVTFAAFILVSWNCIFGRTESVKNALVNKSESTSVAWNLEDYDEDDDYEDDALFTSPPTTPSAPNVDPNPCNRVLPDAPNFNVPGRRISEIKCEEYQWNFKNGLEKDKLNDECEKYRKSKRRRLFMPAVAGGRDALFREFPHMAALAWPAVSGGWKIQCGCTLISSYFVLTAAHCSSVTSLDTTVTNVKPEIVRLTISNIEEWPKDVLPFDRKISKFIVHPHYVSPKKYYDIALVKMEYPISFNDENIQPACLWTKSNTIPLGRKALVTGWGFLDEAGRQKALRLQVAKIDIIDSAQCDVLIQPALNRNFGGLQAHQLCAGVLRGGVDTCQGDSGGPLQVKIPPLRRMSYIIGVTAFGRGCARASLPAVYTRVSSFIDWIEEIVWGNNTVAQK